MRTYIKYVGNVDKHKLGAMKDSIVDWYQSRAVRDMAEQTITLMELIYEVLSRKYPEIKPYAVFE